MIGRVGAVGRAGAAGGSWGRPAVATAVGADFTLSNASVVTAWGLVTVGQLLPVNAPAGSYFVLVEGTAASGDEAGLHVVNG